jgi:signal transduction histidine kinase
MLLAVAHLGLSPEFVRCTCRLPLDDSLAGQAAVQGHPICQQVSDYPPGKLKTALLDEELRTVISVPLMVRSQSVGAIQLGSHSHTTPDEAEMSLLEGIGHVVGVAVENAQLYEQAQQLAIIKERNRLARDLHDSVTQALYGIVLYSEAATRTLASGQNGLAGGHLREIQSTAQESLREMRLLVFELRLPIIKEEGLASAVQARLEAVETRVGLGTKFSSDLEERLPANVEEELYRIAQEALNNTLRHAQASRVIVTLHRNDETVRLEITDDGVGFDPQTATLQGGFGLQSMQERAERLGGQMTVQSQAGTGTQISVEICA